MAKSIVFFMFLILIFAGTPIANLSHSGGEVSDAEVSDDSPKVELNELKSKISLLELRLDERADELKSKEKTIKELEKIIDEKSKNLASLQSEVLSLKDKVPSNAKKQEGKAHGRAAEMDEQISNLKKEIEAQNKKKDALEARAYEAEKRILDLNVKLENLHRTNDDQKSRIRKTQRALEVAEEELMKAKMEAVSISKQRAEVHEAWIPPWLSVHFIYCQSFVVTHWNKHGRPFLELTVKKVLETKSELERWAEPHVDTLKYKWIPVLQKDFFALVRDFHVQLQSLYVNAVDQYLVSKKAIKPHILRLQEVLDPHFQEAKKFTKPYVDQVSSFMKPRVDKARMILKPYTKKVARSYRKFIKNVSVYQQRVQAAVLDLLKSHKITRPLATKEFTSYMASALVAMPFVVALNLVLTFLSKKPKKRVRGSRASHTRRRAKHGHVER